MPMFRVVYTCLWQSDDPIPAALLPLVSDTVASDYARFWRTSAKINVLARILKPSVLSYSGMVEVWAPVKDVIELLDDP